MTDDGIDRDGLPEVCIVVNGPLGMSEGKAIGQAFQAAVSWWHEGLRAGERATTWGDWRYAKTRTIVKIAKTPAIFERICAEVPGSVMRDEGFTEVDENAATMFVSYPYLHRDRPQVLNNKKCPLL